jgi:hypothetical protein
MITNTAKNTKIDPTEISYLFDRLSSLIPKPVHRKKPSNEIKGNRSELNPFRCDKKLRP